MPVEPNSAIEITAFAWVPDFAKGQVRDLRVRWALEEAGLDYRQRLLDAMNPRPEAYFQEQPFGQVPAYRDDKVQLFESGAIVLHIGEGSETLLPRDAAGKARATAWLIAALNSVEPRIMELAIIDFFHAGAEWGRQRRPEVVEMVRRRLSHLANWLGGKDYLEGRFTAGDLMMTAVLRGLRHTGLVAEQPNLAAYLARCEARPGFQRALAAQLESFAENPPAAVA
ncbi:MAG TPA: glutathione S-transferase family protein [Kiloniellaceae bacterium]|nr:glutathione S-transferase family protein [Kiloniellaceae bacterium]